MIQAALSYEWLGIPYRFIQKFTELISKRVEEMSLSDLKNVLLLILLSGSLVGKVRSHNTMWGSTGLIQVPTTTIIRSNETSVSTYASIGGGDTYFGWNVNMAFSDHLELALSDTLGWDQRTGSSTLLSIKYVPLENIAVGGLLDTNNAFQHTAYAIIGSPKNSVYLGLGMNFGNGDANKAMLGNYSKRDQDMETLFIMAGARWDLSRIYPSLEGMVEYNGDTMGLGLGYTPKTNWDVQLDYLTAGDLLPDNQVVLSVGTRF